MNLMQARDRATDESMRIEQETPQKDPRSECLMSRAMARREDGVKQNGLDMSRIQPIQNKWK